MKKIRGINLLLFILFFLIDLPTGSSQDFEVAPTQLKFAVEPGNTETQKVSIRNHNDKKQSFILNIADQVRDSTGKRLTLPAGSVSRSCANWLTINPAFFEINPHESINIDISMQVPSDGYSARWAMVYVRATQEQVSSTAEKVVSTGLRITPRIGIRIYQSPASNTKYKGMITDLMKITQPNDTMQHFSALVHNIGDNRFNASVYLIASDVTTGKEIKTSPVRITVYPDESQLVKLPLTVKLPPGSYSLAALLDYGHNTPLEAIQIMITEK